MRTERHASVAAALLGLLALAASGWIALPPWPDSPADTLALAVPCLALLLLAAAGAEVEQRTPAVRILCLALGCAPFLAFAVGAASGGSVGLALPGVGLAVVLALALALAGAPSVWRRRGAATVLALLAGDAVLATADAALLPAALNPVRAPLCFRGAAPREDGAAAPERRGERPGCFVRAAGDLAPRSGAAPAAEDAWGVATSGPLPRDGRVLRVLHASTASMRPALPGSFRPGGRFDLTLVDQGPDLRHPFDLSAYDALLLGPSAWDDDRDAARRAQAVSAWVRRGGVLFVAGEDARLWPPELERALGPAARRAAEAPGRALRVGEGHVVCASDAASVAQLFGAFADLLESRPLGTAFDGLGVPPSPPPSFRAPEGGPRRRRGQGALLLGFALALWLLEAGARSWRSALALLALPSAVGVLAVLGAAPSAPDVAVHAAVIEIGGPGGRRVEAVWLAAGERGYAGEVAFRGGGATRWIGPPRGGDGRVVLRPGESGWAVRHGEGRGAGPAEGEDRALGWLIGWLRGPVDPGRIALTRGPAPEIDVPGASAPGAAFLSVREP